MDVEETGKLESLDPDMLQLQEVSPFSLKSSPYVAEELFSQWLSLPDTSRLIMQIELCGIYFIYFCPNLDGGLWQQAQNLLHHNNMEDGIVVKSLLADAKAGVPFSALENSTNSNALSINPLPSLFPAGSTPPLSPRSSPGSPRTMKQRTSPSSLGSPLKLVRDPVREIIPQFYFKNGRPPPNEMKEHFLFQVDNRFHGHLDGLQLLEFKSFTKEICKLPSFFSTALFRKIDVSFTGTITSILLKIELDIKPVRPLGHGSTDLDCLNWGKTASESFK
ncbi:serine/threonine protein phosphatase 2A regulatory subunit B subunit alpha-like protein [Trifolium pratense]|uniref:Serine/threonine protein phosphatase 2A regulatory subunit B subunit alpha-like protein n=1 Tax=Trifolium pratense TaxID=57577 RepID=A0A2K3P8Q6_TRIPR|nr:serine/threonine protein phosphatase 2A regulatory subunit B subunit alpha-like protein [Trifolium pratense]